jgi:cytochrome P450
MTNTMQENFSFPAQRHYPLDPPAQYAEARTYEKLARIRLWNGTIAWFVSRYDEVLQVLSDRRFSIDPNKPNFPAPTQKRATMLLNEPAAMAQMDPPDHTRVRRMFTRMFTIANIETYRPRIQAKVDDLIDGMLAKGPPIDLCKEFSHQLPTWVIAELLGVPHADQTFFQESANARFFSMGGPQAALDAGEKLATYLDGLITRKMSEGNDRESVIGRLIVEQINPGQLTQSEAVVHVRNLLINGQDTTANMIALGTITLLQNPDQLDRLKADSSLVSNAVEEMLRYLTNAHFQSPRTALEDVEIGGQLIRKGDGVVASIFSANRDPKAFSMPNTFDISRDSAHHLAFAYGVHQCLGQPVARLELQIVFNTLFRSIPGLRLVLPVEDIKYTGNDAHTYGVYSLPVAW